MHQINVCINIPAKRTALTSTKYTDHCFLMCLLYTLVNMVLKSVKLTLQRSTRSSSRMISTERGSCPAGAFSGISWMLRVWWSRYTDRPYSVSRGFPSSSCTMNGSSVVRQDRLSMCPYPGGVDSSSRKGLQRGEVRVLALNGLSSSWAVVNALHNLGSYQRACREGELAVYTCTVSSAQP